MRNFLLLVLSFVVAVGFAQQGPFGYNLPNKAVKVKHERPIKDVNSFNAPTNPALIDGASYTETELGITKYDLQSNATLNNRFHRFADGRMAYVWTMGNTPSSYPDRGTGLNYSNGTTWNNAPTSRIEDSRTGWPSYTPAGAAGEMILAHRATDLYLSRRDAIGTGSWAFEAWAGPAGTEPAWPRIISSGTDNQYIHAIANSYNAYNNQNTALLYSRSSDGGQSWDFEHQVIEQLGPDYYVEVGGDNYVMASRGNTVAMLVGSAWMDLVLLKSDDNGENWTKTIIWQHPYPMYDFEFETDTFYCVDNSLNISIDKDNIVHVVFGINRVQGTADGSYYLYPGVDGIVYWNENRPTFSDNLHALDPYGHENSELIDNYSLIGWTQDVDGDGEITFLEDLLYYRTFGLSTMPSIYVDDDDYVYVAFATTTEGYENGVNNYKHVWIRTGAAKGELWSGLFTDLTGGIFHVFDECIYPQIAQSSDNENIFLVYNLDNNPGLALNPGTAQHDPVDNKQIFITIPKTDIGVGVNKVDKKNFTVSQNYPNPATGVTKIEVTLSQASKLRVEVANMLGQKVMEVNNGKVAAGSHILSIDVNGLERGVYMYTVYTNTGKVTNKMTIE